MTIVSAFGTRQPLSPGQSLWAIIRDFFSAEASDRVSDKESTQVGTTDQMVKLMEKIDHGYTIDETGEQVSFPSYASTYAKTLIKTGGWV